jgi:hypothetical protein
MQEKAIRWLCGDWIGLAAPSSMHIFIDFGQLCSPEPTTHVHANRPPVFHDFGHPFSTRTAHVEGELGV